MMIVSVMRGELRNEFEMADEVFALSPISARAVLPSEEDYDAISQAFMETSRGRWFLGEYAKRNRNADTRMVLDAVGRIEETLSAQKPPAPDNLLPAALASIRAAVAEAEVAAARSFESLTIQENLAPVRKAARIIREISWRWREIGADARICDLLDSQVSAIEGACGQISETSPLSALNAAFDLIRARIAQLDAGGSASAPAAPETVAPPPTASRVESDEIPTEAAESADEPSAEKDEEAAFGVQAEQVVRTPQTIELTAEVIETPDQDADTPVEVTAEAVDPTSEAIEESAEAADAYDEALLDMVALEMAAPDFIDIDDDRNEMEAAAAATAQPVHSEQPAPKPVPAAPTPVQPSLQPSLGSTLIANGVVRQPPPAGSDPLAPIRRMSQAEKIALFS